MGLKIEDYAMIGDCQTAALVGNNGSIDWLSFPRFDSPACFAALLGNENHGHWQIAPQGEVRRVSRQYRGNSLVLETEFVTDEGTVLLVDCMPLRSGNPDIVRVVFGKSGKVRMHTEYVVRFDYGSVIPWVEKKEGQVVAIAGPDALHLHTPVPLRGENLRTVGDFEVGEGEQVAFVLTWRKSHEPAPKPVNPVAAIDATTKWWHEWSAKCQLDDNCPWNEAIIRSLITLKALTYAPTGGLVAAATTSLPEEIGGVRNWDYRYCWLRDSTFTLAALLQSGYVEEAKAWRDWLIRAVAGDPSQIHIMYGLAGERRLPEMTLPWLPGYENSQPVRIGNAAYDQFQLDVFGEVFDTLHMARRMGMQSTWDDWRIEQQLMLQLEKVWRKPDEGIWEVRGPKQHFTHSKLMAWVAFDRAVKDVEQFGLDGDVQKWRNARDELHLEICSRGFNRKLNSFTQSYDSDHLDASVLVMAEVGFLPPDDPRIRSTIEAIEKRLVRDGFVDRYETASGVDGLKGDEGAFLLCTFWLADNYALVGRMDDAKRTFEQLLSIRNDVGLLSEEYCPIHRRQLGNYPQAFSHLGLINTARTLTRKQTPAEIRQQ